jgi:tRNA pseudouridine38-40 synthase
MRNIRVRVAYDGSCFYGWQRQEGFISVQQAIEEAIEAVSGQSVNVYGSGRTDTGVHALGQVANFQVDTPITDYRLRGALNAHLPKGAVIKDVETCDPGFHAQHSAVGKRYLYVIRNSSYRPVHGLQLAHWTPKPLDFEAMRIAAKAFVGEHDFTSMASSGAPRKTNVRRVHSLQMRRRGDTYWFMIQGSGFLYNMVRTIAGTLMEAGRGKLDAQGIGAILRAKNRGLAGPTAPPGGLYMVRVLYREKMAWDGRRAMH